MTASTDLPDGLARRPIDPRRGLPVPYVNEHPLNGHTSYDFIGINHQRALTCAQQRSCGLCATDLGYWIAFLGGPRTAEARTYADPPMHEECARAALRLCPHIAVRRHKRAPQHRLTPGTSTPVGFVEDKPDRWVMGITRSYRAHTNRGALLFFPAPFKRIHEFAYGDDDTLTETTKR